MYISECLQPQVDLVKTYVYKYSNNERKDSSVQQSDGAAVALKHFGMFRIMNRRKSMRCRRE